ncbi:MAG: Gfo/Idh/MocA family oxidoreductase [Armatimonadota bacterium]|nr:Gfo/Idh/MocA family oxidoreductase [Armatimonadota bacterium]MDR7402327.1 Gfo/Idh/MocA family oxidoreductase [Armatimonadota bacterium]MDR7404366.1 Gfo/Idh/MocA family oxidoreductase [Armatimonadota bacterium]MDR7437312.1 Gfo/Idh/MocA family oxidoreductase [Armatimonadota bacterium]MDR7472651.1 Gfo/Idh/MocA family oxidoreductase [Armatimonadota bacterium]
MPVRVGILGCGFIGRLHALNLKADPRAQLVAVADAVPQAAQRLAAEVQARPLGSLDQLLGEGLDALYVCTPNTAHVEPVLRGLAEGLHVFSEKPMATTLPDAWRIREAARRSRGIYQLGFNRRFANVYRFARRLIDEGKITPLLAQMKHNRGELQQPPWTSDPSVTGGYLYETPVHLFDMGRFLFGEVEELAGWARQSVYRELDGFVVLLRYRSGVIASLTSVAHTSWLFPYERVEIYGEHKTVVTEELERAWFSPGAREQVEAVDCFQMPVERKWGYVAEDRLFIDACLGERPPAVTADDGYRATELVEATYRAVRTGQPVRLPLEEPRDSAPAREAR